MGMVINGSSVKIEIKAAFSIIQIMNMETWGMRAMDLRLNHNRYHLIMAHLVAARKLSPTLQTTAMIIQTIMW